MTDCKWMLKHIAKSKADKLYKDVREAFQKYKREDIIFKLRGIYRPPDYTGLLPQPRFQSTDVQPRLLIGNGSRPRGCFLTLL